MVACSRDTSASSEEGGGDSAAADMPAIYVAQTLVLMDRGQPRVEGNYRQMLDACRKAGLPVTPLGDDDANKLGRTYYQLWFEKQRFAFQKDEWNFELVGDGLNSCPFKAKHTSTRTVTTATASYEMDLVANTSVTEAPLSELGFGGPADAEDSQLSAGLAKLGYQRLGYANDAGQRCLRWRDPSGIESCTWSEGSKWGFSPAEDSGQGDSYDPGAIVLWVTPADGTGFKLTTQKMTVGGEPFDEALFVPSTGLSMKRGGL